MCSNISCHNKSSWNRGQPSDFFSDTSWASGILYAFKYCELSAASSWAPAGHVSLGPSSSLAPSPFSKPPEQENALVLPPSDWWALAWNVAELRKAAKVLFWCRRCRLPHRSYSASNASKFSWAWSAWSAVASVTMFWLHPSYRRKGLRSPRPYDPSC